MEKAFQVFGLPGQARMGFPRSVNELARLVAPENGGSKILLVPGHAMVVQAVTNRGWVRVSDSMSGRTFDVPFQKLLQWGAHGLVGVFR